MDRRFAVLWLAAAEAEILEASILSYNIYWGGQDHDPVFGRQDEWLEVIIAAAPDVIMLQECNGWLASEQDLLNQHLITLNAALPGGPVYHGVAADANSDFNVALITYQPILSWEAVTSVFVDGETVNLAHACLHAVLDFEGEPQHVLNMHFKPGWENRNLREREARALVQYISELPAGEVVWVGGDFNSYSPVDSEPDSPTQPNYAGGAAQPEIVGWEPVAYLLDVSMRITPNPATGRVAIHFELLQPQHLILDLIAPDGRRLRSLDAGYRNPGSHTIIFDRGAPCLPAGGYYLRPRGTSTLRATPMRIL